MKKIVLLITIILTGVSTLRATYSEQFLSQEQCAKLGKKTKQIDGSIEAILSFNPAQKSPAQIEARLFRALILSNSLGLKLHEPRSNFLINFLLSDIHSFKSLINYLVDQNPTIAADFLVQFHKVNNRDLNTLLMMEIDQCIETCASLKEKELDENEKDIVELVSLEWTQLIVIQSYLTCSPLAAEENVEKYLQKLKDSSIKKRSLLNKITPFLIFAAAGGAAYVATQHGDYIAQLAIDIYNTTNQFILEKTGVNIGEAVSNIPTREAAMAMVQALPGLVRNFGYKAAVQNAFNRALEGDVTAIGTLTATGGTVLGGAGYGTYRLGKKVTNSIEQRKQTQARLEKEAAAEAKAIKSLTEFSTSADDLFLVNGVAVDLHEAKLLTGWYNWGKEKQESTPLSQDIMPQFFQEWTPNAIQKDLMYLVDRSQSSETYPLGKKATYIYKIAYEKCEAEHPELLQYFRIFNPKLLPAYESYEYMRINAPGVPSGMESAHKYFQNCFLRSVGAKEILPLSKDYSQLLKFAKRTMDTVYGR